MEAETLFAFLIKFGSREPGSPCECLLVVRLTDH
jgi:hypothetical protein